MNNIIKTKCLFFFLSNDKGGGLKVLSFCIILASIEKRNIAAIKTIIIHQYLGSWSGANVSKKYMNAKSIIKRAKVI